MNTWIAVTGLTLLHFVWQGTFIALAAGMALRMLHRRSPHARYTVACAALAAMLCAPIVTARIVAASSRVAIVQPTTAAAARSAAASDDRFAPGVRTVPSFPGSRFLPAGTSVDVAGVLPTIVAVWMAGVSLLLLQLGGGWWRVRRIQAIAMLEPSSNWADPAQRLADRLGIARALRIVDSTMVDTPTVIGWMRPVILLPLSALANLTPSQVEAILAHELAHVRRHDFVVNLAQTIAETLLFYHPGVWWLSRRIRIEREHCCDDIAVQLCGDPYAYAAALTEIAAAGGSPNRLAVAATAGPLLHRVRRLLGAENNRRSAGGTIVAGLALALIVVAGALRWYVIAQEPATYTDQRGFGPRDLNRLLGFELLPGRAQHPTDDPRESRAWLARVHHGDAEMTLIGFTARSLIRGAYGLADIPVAGAPDWMDGETFDITIPSAAAIVLNGVPLDEAVNTAIRQYFENKLNLSWHFETREFPVYALVRAGDGLGPNIRPAAGGCGFDCGVDNDLFGVMAKSVTMADFVRDVRIDLSPLPLGRDVIDRTGLIGAYDFELRIGLLPLAAIAHRSPVAAELLYPAGVRSIHSALPMQLGLKLEESTAPRQVLVIDHIDRPPRTQ